MKNNKKGAMELGISTVVMLVIAIVIIGGGIAFIRNFFGQGTESLTGAFEVADFGLEPTAGKPLVLTDGQMNIKTGKTDVVRIGFYNRQGNTVLANVGFEACATTANTESACGVEGVVKPKITSLPQSIEVGEQAGFGTQITAECDTESEEDSGSLPPGTYTCSLVVYECADNDDGSLADCYNEEFEDDEEVLERTQIIFTVTS